MVARTSVAALFVAALLGGCIDKGFMVVAENHTTDALLGRATIFDLRFDSKTATVTRTQQVVALPAGSRLAVATEPFTGPQIELVEILQLDCTVIGKFTPDDGTYVVISDGPSLHITREDQTADAGTQVPDCHPEGPLPTPSPSQAPGRIIGTTPADGAANVSRTDPIVAHFSPGSYTGWPTVILRVAGTLTQPKDTIAYDHDVRIELLEPLRPNTEYELTVETSASYTPIDKVVVHFTTGP